METHTTSEKCITEQNHPAYCFKDNIYIFCWESDREEYHLSLRMSVWVMCMVWVSPKLSLFEILSKDFKEFLCIRINLALRAAQNRLVDWCGSDCCDCWTVKVLSFLQMICAGGRQNMEQILKTVESEVSLGSVDLPENSYGTIFCYESQLCFVLLWIIVL